MSHFKVSQIILVTLALLLAGCDDPEQRAAEHFQKGIDFFEEGDFEKARLELLNAFQLNTSNAEAAYRLGQIEERNGDLQQAFSYYLTAADPAFAHIPAQVRLAELLTAGGRFDDAAGRATAAIGLEPRNPDLLALRGMIELMRRDQDQAMEDARTALDIDPAHVRAITIVATVHLDLGEPQQALDIIAPALDAAGGAYGQDEVALLILRALAHERLEDLPATVDTFRTIVEAEPEVASHRRTLAELLAASGRIDEAETVLLDGIEAAPDIVTMQLVHVDFLAEYRGPEATIDRLQALIEGHPDSGTYDVVLANFHGGLDQPDRAIEVLQQARERLGTAPEANAVTVTLAAFELRAGRGGQALTLVNQALDADPEQVDALLLRASINRLGGRQDSAIRDLNSALRVDPANRAALQLLAESYTASGQLQEALSTLQSLAEFAPGNQAIQLRMAGLLQQLGRTDEAQTVLDEQLTQSPDSTVLWRAMARSAIGLEDWAGARSAIDELGAVAAEAEAAGVEQTRLLAELAVARANYAEAAEAYRSILRETRDVGLDVAALFGFVQSSVQAGQFESALGYLDTIIDDPEPEVVHLGHRLASIVHARAGDDELARESILAAIQVLPGAAPAYVDLARSYMRANQPAAARDLLHQGLDAGAAREPLLITLGMVEETQGNIDAALDAYGQTLEINPLSIIAANNYGSLLADAAPDDAERIAAALERLADLRTSEEPLILDTIAWLSYRIGDYQVARTLLERAGAATHDNPQLRFHYGAVLLAVGETEAGTEVLSSTVGLTFPGHEEAAELLAAN